jgi:hypothetical protein
MMSISKTVVRAAVAAAAVMLLGVGACTTQKPYVSVLGVSRIEASSQSVQVVVEIHNPTQTPLRLSQLKYTFAAAGKARGTVQMTRVVEAGRSAVIDFRVPLQASDRQGDHYQLDGQISGYAGDVQINFNVAAGGELPSAGAVDATAAPAAAGF